MNFRTFVTCVFFVVRNGGRVEPTDKLADRLALLEGVNLSEADLDYIAAEIEDLDRVVAELEDFAQGIPWVSQQVQPAGNKV
jgi:hypothetical protein